MTARSIDERLQALENALQLLVHSIGDAQEELKKIKKEQKELAETPPVGRFYEAVPSKHLQKLTWSLLDNKLIEEAHASANWLEQKTMTIGSGAAADSGEARIVGYLRELCHRLEAKK